MWMEAKYRKQSWPIDKCNFAGYLDTLCVSIFYSIPGFKIIIQRCLFILQTRKILSRELTHLIKLYSYQEHVLEQRSIRPSIYLSIIQNCLLVNSCMNDQRQCGVSNQSQFLGLIDPSFCKKKSISVQSRRRGQCRQRAM